MRAASQRVVLVVGPSFPWPTEPSANLGDGSCTGSSSMASNSSSSSVQEAQRWGRPGAGVGCGRWSVATEPASSSSNSHSSNSHSNRTSTSTSTSTTPASSALSALHSAFASVTLSSLNTGLLPRPAGGALPLNHGPSGTLPHDTHSQEPLSHNRSHRFDHSTALADTTCQSQPPQLLFSLAEAHPSRGSRGAAAAAGGGGLEDDLSLSGLLPPGADLGRMLQGALMGAGDEEYGELDSEQQEAELARLHCGFCRRRLGRRAAGGVVLCDGCHRPFHGACCAYRGIGLGGRPARVPQPQGDGGEGPYVAGRAEDGSWNHSGGCAESRAVWWQRAAAGPLPAGNGCTLLLLPTQLEPVQGGRQQGQGSGGGDGEGDGQGAAGRELVLQGARRRDAAEGLQQAAGLLAAEFGPRAVDALLDSDWAALLRDPRGGAAAAAALDVYGREVVLVDLMATAAPLRPEAPAALAGGAEEEARRWEKGHGRLLVDSLESWLTHAGTHNVVVVVSGEGREGGALKRVWARRGFKQLAPRQARAWARELPGFPSGGRGTVLMRRRLQGAEGGGEGEREGQGAGVVAEVAGAARRVAGGVVGGLWGAAKGVVAYVTLSGR